MLFFFYEEKNFAQNVVCVVSGMLCVNKRRLAGWLLGWLAGCMQGRLSLSLLSVLCWLLHVQHRYSAIFNCVGETT